ncbi:MAG: SPOR domain-containing protein [Acidimicrobiia bacterium]|nr:SPOR domain-containing protein [Acidimicrobiia bacterium]
MRTLRLLVWLVVAAVIGAACSSGGDSTTLISPRGPETSIGTGAPNTSETQAANDPPPAASGNSTPVPAYLVYGWEGVTRVQGEMSEQVVSEPVLWATEDGAGGIVFESVAAEPGWAWLAAGANHPKDIAAGGGTVFLIDGRPTVLVSRTFDDMTRCEEDGYLTEELSIRDLASGDERFFMCHALGPDNEDRFTSFGGGLFSVVKSWWMVGSGTSGVQFYDLNGEEVGLEHNPFAESCHPCRAHAQLSPDGALLAYSLWPTAFANQPEPPDGDYDRAFRDWYEQAQHIPTAIVVMDVATGAEVFRTELGADVALTEFDGRMVTVTTTTGRHLFAIESGETFSAPPAQSTPAPFWTVLLASLDNTTMDYDAAQRAAGELAAEHGAETGVLWSDGYSSLNPGFWAVFTGHFSTQDAALARCEALDIDCYPRYVANASVAGPSHYRYGDDGLYRVAAGTETQLEVQPVVWAADDLMGGVMYRLHWQLDPETTYWLRADKSREALGYHPQFVAAIDDEPTAVTFGSASDEELDMLLVDIRSGSQARVPNIGFGGDGWSYPRSHGEGLFVGVDGVAVGCGYSDTVLSFWDSDGTRVDHPHNPIPEPCGPCELSAALSPDGHLLAYSHRADSPSDYHGRLTCEERDDWWEETQEILARVVVLDLATGDEVFQVMAPARASVVDFDGRFIVVEQEDWLNSETVSIVHDTWGVRQPIEVNGGVALIR